jgi:hypothetical protein
MVKLNPMPTLIPIISPIEHPIMQWIVAFTPVFHSTL